MPAVPSEEAHPACPSTEADPPVEAEEKNCRVYVGNLAWGVRSEELKAHMEPMGEVVRAYVFEDFQGRSKGCGIVVYKTEEAAQKSIRELTDSILHERPIFVREDREENSGKFAGGRAGSRPRVGRFDAGRSSGRSGGYGSSGGPPAGYTPSGGPGPASGGGSGGRQVFVSNLPWKTSWQDLKDIFRECGEVVRAEVMEMPDGRSKGIGTVLFTTPEGAQHAVENFNNYPLEGRHISVRYDRKEY